MLAAAEKDVLSLSSVREKAIFYPSLLFFGITQNP